MGLGNPGPRYAASRHNVGFMAIEEFGSRHGRGAVTEEMGGLVRRARWAGEDLLLFRPLSYMNRSGGPVRALCRARGVETADLVVVYDDADLPLGLIRVRAAGRPAGHRGMASISEALDEERISRIRLGIGKPRDGEGDLSEFVLEEFLPSEREALEEMIREAAGALEVLVREGVTAAMNRYNKRAGLDA